MRYEVTGVQPAVDEHGRRLLGHLVVATHDRRVAHLELAFVGDPRLVDLVQDGMLLGPAQRAVGAGAGPPDEAVRRLGHPVGANDLEAEAALDLELALLGR